MKERITDYLYHKWMLSAIYRESGYINEQLKNDPEFEYVFLSNVNLNYLISILNGEYLFQMFDEHRLENIASAMKQTIEKYKDINSNIVEYCTKIIELTKNPKGKSVKSFYKEQYNVRNQTNLKILTENMKLEVDKQMIIEIDYLSRMWSRKVDQKLPTNDIKYLKALNIFISECPEIIYEESFNSYIEYVLETNEAYEEDIELQKLNNLLEDYYCKTMAENQISQYEILNHAIISLIFRTDVNETLKALKGTDFFEQTQFDIICNIIMENKDTCAFDSTIRNNLRTVLFTFIEENKELNFNYSLNDLKLALNIYEDKNFKKKNRNFYIETGVEFLDKMSAYDIAYIDEYKKRINCYLGNVNEIISIITNDEIDYINSSNNKYLPGYINYILTNMPYLAKNRVYMERIEDMLIANQAWMEEKQEETTLSNNTIVTKKVKKLCK